MGTYRLLACADDTALVDRPRLAAEDWAKFGAGVEALAAFAAEQGITLVYHHHMGTVVESEDDRTWVMKFVGAGQGAKVLTAEVMPAPI